MCGHGGLLVNVVFSLTGIFHGSAGGMSSGHTWHWGTAEQSHQIPLGKPGLVIPRCETLASRSVTFPLHQRKVQRCTHTALSTPPLSRHEDLQLRVQRGGKKRVHSKEEGALFTSPRHHHSSSKTWLKKKKDERLYPSLSSSCCTDHETVLTQLTNTSSESGKKPCTASLHHQQFRTADMQSTMHLWVYSKGFGRMWWAQRL